MVALSKYFEQGIATRSCNDIVHTRTCIQTMLHNVPSFFFSNAKYYLPMALLQVFVLKMKAKKLDAQTLRRIAEQHFQLSWGGFLNGYVCACFICFFRNLNGRFHLPTLLFVPSLLGGTLNWLQPKYARQQHQTAMFQFVMESLLLWRGNVLTRAIHDSERLQTLIFMCCSAIIVQARQRQQHQQFWFLQPEQPGCRHAGSCTQHVLRGMRNYLLIGLGLGLAKLLLEAAQKTGGTRLRLQPTALLTAYMGIYRASHCALQRYRPRQHQAAKHLLAAFVGGAAYACYPKLGICAYAMLQAWQVLWRTQLAPHQRSLPYGELLFPPALAYIIHTYVLFPQRVSRLAALVVDGATANYASNLRQRLLELNGALPTDT